MTFVTWHCLFKLLKLTIIQFAVCCQLRDYFDEIQASISIGAAEWKLENLCLWSDLVIKKQPLDPNAAANPEQTMEDAEADLEAAEFAAIRTKLAQLCL